MVIFIPSITFGDPIVNFPGTFAYWTAENSVLTGGITFVSLPDTSNNQKTVNNLTIPTGAGGVAPTWIRNDPNFNGMPSIAGTAINQRVQSSGTVAFAQAYTVYHVLRHTSNANTMYWRSAGGNFSGSAGLYVSGGSNSPTMQNLDTGGHAINTSNTLTTGTSYVTSSVYDNAGATSALYVNNSQTAFMSQSGTTNIIDAGSCTQMTVGNFGSVATYSWTAMAVISGSHDAPTRKFIMSFFGGKYNIPVT